MFISSVPPVRLPASSVSPATQETLKPRLAGGGGTPWPSAGRMTGVPAAATGEASGLPAGATALAPDGLPPGLPSVDTAPLDEIGPAGEADLGGWWAGDRKPASADARSAMPPGNVDGSTATAAWAGCSVAGSAARPPTSTL